MLTVDHQTTALSAVLYLEGTGGLEPFGSFATNPCMDMRHFVLKWDGQRMSLKHLRKEKPKQVVKLQTAGLTKAL